MYIAKIRFADSWDGNHVYEVGDRYPRAGVTVTNNRLEELLSDDNSIGTPVIALERPEKGLSRPTEASEELNTDVNPPATKEAKKRPRRKSQK